MKRLLSLVLMVALLGASGPVSGVSDPGHGDRPAGIWRMTVEFGGELSITFLISLESQNNQWTGQCLGASGQLPGEAKIENVRVSDDRLRFSLMIGTLETSFDGRVPPEGPIRGSFLIDQSVILTSLEPSQLPKFDRFELLKEVVAATESVPVLFESVVELLDLATENKATPEEVRAWIEKAVKAAEAYGVRYQRTVVLRTAEALADQPDYTAIALAQAQRAERLLEPADDITTVQMPILEVLAKLLRQADKAEDAKAVLARIDQIEERAYQEYVKRFPLPFEAEAYAGRKGRSERAVLLELFTGAECPPCVAADIAFDALGKTYKASEVVRLQYHLHIPGPDPLTNTAAEARGAYYQVGGTPTTLFNGKEEAGGGGGFDRAHLKFLQYRGVIDPLLETPARARVQVSAQRDGDKITVNARVSEVTRPGDKVRLRLALAEEIVRYYGGNGIGYHHHVVRGFVGGPDGIALPRAVLDHKAEVRLDELRGALNDYLDKFQQDEGVTFPYRPLALRKLKVVAFVQDDTTKEVLQVAQAEVK